MLRKHNKLVTPKTSVAEKLSVCDTWLLKTSSRFILKAELMKAAPGTRLNSGAAECCYQGNFVSGFTELSLIGLKASAKHNVIGQCECRLEGWPMSDRSSCLPSPAPHPVLNTASCLEEEKPNGSLENCVGKNKGGKSRSRILSRV